MGEVTVLPDAVRAAMSEFDDINGTLRDGLRRLDSEVEELLSSGWRGEAASFFRDHYQEMKNHAGYIVDDAAAISESVVAAIAEYERTDGNTAVSVSSHRV